MLIFSALRDFQTPISSHIIAPSSTIPWPRGRRFITSNIKHAPSYTIHWLWGRRFITSNIKHEPSSAIPWPLGRRFITSNIKHEPSSTIPWPRGCRFITSNIKHEPSSTIPWPLICGFKTWDINSITTKIHTLSVSWKSSNCRYRVIHKGWDFRDDCIEFILFVSLYS